MLMFMVCRGSQAGTQWAHQAFNLILQPPCRSWKTMSHLARDKGPDVKEGAPSFGSSGHQRS